MARNNIGFKWRGTIGKDKYISLAHPYDAYKPFTAEPSPIPASLRNNYASFGAPQNNGASASASSVDTSILNGANAGSAINAGLSAIKSMAPMLDAAFAPSMTKIVGEMTADIYSDNAVISHQVLIVDDINEVGRIYESNGYAVTRYIQGSPFSVHNRRMYDYIQCDEVNVTGTMDGMALEDIKARLADGIRMWHTNEHVLVCELSPFSIAMGQLCVKDNTEV